MSPPSGRRPAGSALGTRFSERLTRLNLRPGRALVAVSGGVDSVVLLDLLHQGSDRHGLELIVAHVDHGIHPKSSAVAGMVERRAAELGLAFLGVRLALGPAATETGARTSRMRWLEAARRESGAHYILLAHQADDQAETVLMRLLRGSGPAGLAGMSARQGALVRPLLPFTRLTLLHYAKARGLEWQEDPANHDPRHLRSWIRRDVIPLLAQRLPDLGGRLRRAGKHAARDRRAWTQVLDGWPGLDGRREDKVYSVSWVVLTSLPRALRVTLLQTLTRLSGLNPGPRRIAGALGTLEQGQSGATADLVAGWSLERSFDRLRLLPPRGDGSAESVSIAGTQGELNWGGFQLRWSPERAPRIQPRDGDTAWFIPGTLVVRPWHRGDRLSPLGGRGHRLAVRCFQEARVPSSERRRWPILEGEGEVAWIPGVCRSDRLVPRAGDPALRVDVARRG